MARFEAGVAVTPAFAKLGFCRAGVLTLHRFESKTYREASDFRWNEICAGISLPSLKFVPCRKRYPAIIG